MLTKIQKRKLGKSNLEVSAIGLGCVGLVYATSCVINNFYDILEPYFA